MSLKHKIKNNDICHGCADYNACILAEERSKNKCPCSNCLLKGICENLCEEFTNFAINIIN